MSVIPHDGAWTYRSTFGGSLAIASSEKLLGLRVIAVGSSGNFTMENQFTTAPEPIAVTTQMAFDWTPSARVTLTTFVFSSTTLQWFAEIGI